MAFIMNDPEIFFSKKNQDANNILYLQNYFKFNDKKDLSQIEYILNTTYKK